MYKCFTGGIAIVLMAAILFAQEKEPEQEQEPSYWMKQKLKYAQEILNGLALEDYERITKNANAMKGLNRIEYFVRQRPKGYRTQLLTFQFSVDELVRSGEEKNLDTATLAFNQMTISCVNCHKQLRMQ